MHGLIFSETIHKVWDTHTIYTYTVYIIIFFRTTDTPEDKVSQAMCNVSVNNVQLGTFICSVVVM